MPAIVTFTTDFGTSDPFVGQMKGAALTVEPSLCLVDLCHEVPAHDVAAGAFLLETGVGAFPAGTIHVAVIDPGVGTARLPIAVRTARFVFIAPDNGVLSRVLERDAALELRRLDEGALRRPGGATTFDGRDLFAPAAAWLARGRPFAAMGREIAAPLRLPARRAAPVRGSALAVPVVWIDRFGNVCLDVRADELSVALDGTPLAHSGVEVRTPAGPLREVRRAYGDPGREEVFLVVGSSGYVELAADRGRADARLGLRRGATVELTLR